MFLLKYNTASFFLCQLDRQADFKSIAFKFKHANIFNMIS